MENKNNKFICFDRDGTINREVLYLSNPDDVELYPEVIPALQKLTAAGYGIFIVTNQSGIGRGYYSEADMHAVNRRVSELLRAAGVTVAGFYYCPHTPDDDCNCRKPLTTLIDRAAVELGFERESIVVVGDKIIDVEFGQNAGGKGVLVRTGHGSEVILEEESTVPDYVCDNLQEAVTWILCRE